MSKVRLGIRVIARIKFSSVLVIGWGLDPQVAAEYPN